ncbi:phage tail protein [Pseudomonas anguilliseptica]|uniref:phage tail protein n=1 Tax=Pseudomonas anguilliseptica TaxID=53406 RepID=UPI00325ABECC
MRFYSQETGCTYIAGIHSDQMPRDAKPISEELYLAVIANPLPGKVRGHDADGLPMLIDPPPPRALSYEEVDAIRRAAYADPMTGSDRYFAEAQREAVMGNAEAAEAAKALGLARFAEIQAAHPWPEE